MLIEQAITVAAASELVLLWLADVTGKDLAAIAGAATSSGEALLETSGLRQLDGASHHHFGAQFGRSISRGAITALPLRWWNDKARSLTPGLIGEIRVRPLADQLTELAIVGQYYPQAHLYELVDPVFLGRMGTAVVSSFLDGLGDRILKLTSTPATVHSIAP